MASRCDHPLATATGHRHAALLGLGSYRPSRVVTNEEICEHIDSSDEWIRTRSGIVERRFSEPHETVELMSTEAARQALDESGVDPSQVGLVIVATVSHLLQTPAVAPKVSHNLGTTPAAAFDISAACAGFCHGIALAADSIRAGSTEYAVVIGVERLSEITDPTDRGTAFIFADGAGAVVVGPSDVEGIGPVVWGADGEHFDHIRQEEEWSQRMADEHPQMPTLRMKGSEVFRWASYGMVQVARDALERAGMTIDELDVFVPHQANNRITDAMARALHMPEDVVIARDIVHQGNTSAASIPLAARALVDDGLVESGQTALFIAFGAGLAYAAQVVRLP